MVEGYSHESALIQTAECWSITDESVRSLVGECSKIAQIHYKTEHDAIDTVWYTGRSAVLLQTSQCTVPFLKNGIPASDK